MTLEKMHRALARLGADASLRNPGAGQFVYAEKGGRALELYADDSGGWILECWERGGEEDASPVREERLETTSSALKAAVVWLDG